MHCLACLGKILPNDNYCLMTVRWGDLELAVCEIVNAWILKEGVTRIPHFPFSFLPQSPGVADHKYKIKKFNRGSKTWFTDALLRFSRSSPATSRNRFREANFRYSEDYFCSWMFLGASVEGPDEKTPSKFNHLQNVRHWPRATLGANSIDINFGPKFSPRCQFEKMADWQAAACLSPSAELARVSALKLARILARDFLCQLNWPLGLLIMRVMERRVSVWRK